MEDEALYQKILSKDHEQEKEKVRTLAREFLLKHPDSPLRYEILAILKKIVPKNMQLYTIERTVFPSCTPPALFLMASGIQEVDLSLWKVDLVEAAKQKDDIYLLKTQSNAVLLKQWKVKASKEGWISQKLKLDKLSPGCYLVLAEDEDLRTEIGFFISDFAMMVKHTEKQSLVWISPSDGQNMKDACSLYIMEEQKQIYTKKTNPGGLWTGSLPKDLSSLIFLASTDKGDIMAAQATWYHYERELQKVYVYPQKPSFSPGEEIIAKIFPRSFLPQKQEYAFKKERVYLSLQDSFWNMLVQKEVLPGEYGTCEFRYLLPLDARPGRYCLRIRGWCMGEFYFDVCAENSIKKEHISLEKKEAVPPALLSLTTDKSKYQPGEDIKISLRLAQKVSNVLIVWEGDSLLGYHHVPECPENYDFSLQAEKSFCPEIKVTAYLFSQDILRESSQKISIVNREKILNLQAKKQSQKEWEILILDHKNEPVMAEVLVAADIVENTIQEQSSNIEDFYYASRYIALPTVDSLDFEFTTDREFSCLQPISSKMTLTKQPLAQNREISFVSPGRNIYWNSHLKSDENGIIRIALPSEKNDFLRIAIIAIDKKNRIGQKIFFFPPEKKD